MSTKTMIGIGFIVILLATLATVLYGLIVKNYEVAGLGGTAGFLAGIMCVAANSEFE